MEYCPCNDKRIADKLVPCSQCGHKWHLRCARQHGVIESKFECAICILHNQDPLHQVLEKLYGATFLNNGTKYQFRLSHEVQNSIKFNPNIYIEVSKFNFLN